MKPSVTGVIVIVSLFAVAGSVSAAPTAAQKCRSLKIKETGKYSLCRLKADAKAVKKGVVADYAKCDQKLLAKFAKLELKFGAECPTTGDVSSMQDRATECAVDLACRTIEPLPPSGSIVALPVQVAVGEDPNIVLENTGTTTAYAYCIYVSDLCTASDFIVPIPPLGGLEWVATVGIAGPEFAVPPIPTIPFSGELSCTEIQSQEIDPIVPVSGNHLRASIQYGGECPIAAVPIAGLPTNDGDSELCLGASTITIECPLGAEYDACPDALDADQIQNCWSLSLLNFDCR